jgi:hypothetical protein
MFKPLCRKYGVSIDIKQSERSYRIYTETNIIEKNKDFINLIKNKQFYDLITELNSDMIDELKTRHTDDINILLEKNKTLEDRLLEVDKQAHGYAMKACNEIKHDDYVTKKVKDLKERTKNTILYQPEPEPAPAPTPEPVIENVNKIHYCNQKGCQDNCEISNDFYFTCKSCGNRGCTDNNITGCYKRECETCNNSICKTCVRTYGNSMHPRCKNHPYKKDPEPEPESSEEEEEPQPVPQQILKLPFGYVAINNPIGTNGKPKVSRR